MKAREHVVSILLAGGKSSRMGGGDKCLLPLAGRPILAHVIERLKPQVAELIVSANGDPARFSAFGLPLRRSVPMSKLTVSVYWPLSTGLAVQMAVRRLRSGGFQDRHQDCP